MNEQQQKELKRLRRLLDQMYRVAEHASLTGAFDAGAVEIISRYNLILPRLNSLGIDTSYLFLPLPEDASLDRVGIACKLLSSYIDEEDDEHGGHRFGPNVVIGGPHGMPDLEHLKDIGRIVRENIAESLGRARHEPPPPPPTPSTPPVAPEEAPTQPHRF